VPGLSLDETTDRRHRNSASRVRRQAPPIFDQLAATTISQLPQGPLRESAILTHLVFNRYHSETELMRYLRKLADKDLALIAA
jgi:glycine dehydrogenase